MLKILFFGLLAVAVQAQDNSCSETKQQNLEKLLLSSDFNNPIQLDVSSQGVVYVIEKVSGNVKKYNPQDESLSQIGQLDVFSPAHEGLIGLVLDPDFDNNHYIYLYYTHPSLPQHELARFEEVNGVLDMDSKTIILTVPGIRWNNQHHSAGDMVFTQDRILYLATGENVDPSVSNGYASVNESDRQEDTQATSANSNDLNGKILRIVVNEDGSYSLPEGNLFEEGQNTKGEIYTMGHRNPFRIALDKKRNWLYWAEPGPDARSDNSSFGPEGRDEINQAKEPGFYGWPYFVGENLAYVVNGQTKNPKAPTNASPLNTGLTELPPAQPSIIDYTDGGSSQYNAFGNQDARAAILGDYYNYDAYLSSESRLPPSFNNSLFTMDWSRDFILEIEMDSLGNVLDVVPFLENEVHNGPIDMVFSPSGDMYLLEYDSHSLYQIKYSGDCHIDPPANLRQAIKNNFGQNQKMVYGLESALKALPEGTLADVYSLSGENMGSLSIRNGLVYKSSEIQDVGNKDVLILKIRQP